MYYSKLSTSSGKWGSPKEMLAKEMKSKKAAKRMNSSYFESSATMTEDGEQIYFVSERPGGLGQADIYYIKKAGKTWSDPISVGTNINTSSDEKCVFIHPSGNILFFSSNGFDECFGSYDLYYSIKDEQGNWGKPVNMGAPINSNANDFGIYFLLATDLAALEYNVHLLGVEVIVPVQITAANFWRGFAFPYPFRAGGKMGQKALNTLLRLFKELLDLLVNLGLRLLGQIRNRRLLQIRKRILEF